MLVSVWATHLTPERGWMLLLRIDCTSGFLATKEPNELLVGYPVLRACASTTVPHRFKLFVVWGERPS